MRHVISQTIFALCFFWGLFSSSASATDNFSHTAVWNGTLNGSTMTWDNGLESAGAHVTSDIFIPLALAGPAFYTNRWYPMTFNTDKPVPSNITFVHQDGIESILTQARVSGIEHQIPSGEFQSDTLSSGEVANLRMGECAFFQNKSSSIVLYSTPSEHCRAPVAMDTKGGGTLYPVQGYRPTFDIPDSTWDLFQGKPSGLYTANFFAHFQYLFRYGASAGGVRIGTNIIITIDYKGGFLSDVKVFGDGEIPPTYDKANKEVYGETKFDIVATGSFPSGSGLLMDFQPKSEYALKNISSGGKETKIGYYVQCDSCNINSIVSVDSSGMGKINSTAATDGVKVPVGTNNSEIRFDLRVGYGRQGFADVTTGHYTDSFQVIFRADI